MALATQCPHCNTTFRVAQDQLKLRAGLVRCGSCKEIFNGIEHLLRPDSAAAHPSPATNKPTETPTAKVAAESPARAPEHVAEPAIMEDVASAGIPISLLAKPVAPKAEPASSQLDFAYPDPLPEAEPKPDPEPMPEPEPIVEPEAVAVAEQEEEQQEELEAHAAEAVEFVDFVDVPRKPREPVEETYDIADTQPEDPLQRMTLVDLSEGEAPDEPYMADIPLPEESQAEPPPEEPDPLDAVIDELKRKPLRSTKKKPKPYTRLPTQEVAPEAVQEETPDPEDISDSEEPEFVKQSRRNQTVGRTMRIAMGVGSFFLLVGALGQATYTFRDLIAAHVPETKPILVDACLLLNCKVGLPAQIETISIESDQLETLNTNKDVSELTMLLRNVSTTSQTWPHLELTLNDANNTMLSRRVFAPQEYLPTSADEKKGFASNAEQPVKLDFEFTGTKPAGYHVGVFYP